MWKGFRGIFLIIFFAFFLVLSAEQEIKPAATIEIPLRDGEILEADVYLPPSGERNHPSILLRSPYGKKSADLALITTLTEDNYVVIVQETRSAKNSDEISIPFLTDHQDGLDTIHWLEKSGWGNGKIGTCGTSALAITQHILAPLSPDALAAQYIRFGAPSLDRHVFFKGGQLCKEVVEGWLSQHAPQPEIFTFLLEKQHDTLFWQKFDALEAVHTISAPAVHIGGWYDVFLDGTLDGFRIRHEEGATGARRLQKLVVGPWSHFWPHHQAFGEFEVPENGKEVPEVLSQKSWFDYHLKGTGPDLFSVAPVHYYLMGSHDGSASSGNEWKTADSWPVPATIQQLFLNEKRELNEVEPTQDATATVAFDPSNPVPTKGGRNLFIASGPMDQREIEVRDDVILFTSAVLEKDQEVTGNIKMKLFVSSDTEDATLSVRLSDVYPDGRSILISDGLKRIQVPNKTISEIEVDLSATSQVFAKGHRVRIAIAGSNYPRFEILNHPSKTTIHTSKLHPSQLLLPIVF